MPIVGGGAFRMVNDDAHGFKPVALISGGLVETRAPKTGDSRIAGTMIGSAPGRQVSGRQRSWGSAVSALFPW